jgi:hypothetical protein
VADRGSLEDRLFDIRCNVLKPQRCDQPLTQHSVERLAPQYLHQPPENNVAALAVRELISRWKQLRHVGKGADVLFDCVVVAAGVGEQVTLKSRSVAEQLARRHRRARCLVGDVELRQILTQRPVQIQQSLVGQLLHQRRRPHLGDRPDLEHRVGRDRDPGGDIA